VNRPPGHAPEEDIAAPERDREVVGSHLPRRIRDQVVRDFMAMFPGIPAGRALEMARAFIADPDGFQAKMRGAHVDPIVLEQLARLMEELPLGLSQRPARRNEEYQKRAARQRWHTQRGLVPA
jgi:hypothetical protein